MPVTQLSKVPQKSAVCCMIARRKSAACETDIGQLGHISRHLVPDEQQTIFLQAPFTYWGVYIAALTLTIQGQTVFGAKDVRQKLKGILGDLWDTPGAKAGSVMPSDAVEGSKYSGGFDCLRIVQQGKRPTYCWIGFKSEQ